MRRAFLAALVLLGGGCAQWRALIGEDTSYEACVAKCQQEDHAFCERDCASTGNQGPLCAVLRPGH